MLTKFSALLLVQTLDAKKDGARRGGKRGLPLVVDGKNKNSIKYSEQNTLKIEPMKMTNKQPAMRFIPKISSILPGRSECPFFIQFLCLTCDATSFCHFNNFAWFIQRLRKR